MAKRKRTRTERFLQTARRQFQRCCIPTATAVCVSVGISKLGVPALPLLLLGGAGLAYWKGYRVRIQLTRPEPATEEPNPTTTEEEEG